ncbi:hypothetical protein KGR20_09880 [Cytobacillus oceanisediminis]|uniref:Uncharacterized protein n=1 Tax=Niallia alba TaxID=2729105 RepID=A0A7Y0PKU8_9BACI|nr:MULTISPECIES: hypothetical protein [Bacillaceae]EOR24605.1 hypothetical protein A499_07580 [Niallia nealsonii AAU1]MBZ9534565.1 hypothetical protein [Cytobacillus oceanisediminis]NMO76055.1 hypothetical protein [Niallia alba]UTI43858.1 hypothetical protein NKG37_09520 [Niallia sp. RD1]
MSDVKLFTAIYIPETPFVNGGLKPKSTKKNNFDLLESEKIADTLYHFIIKRMKYKYTAIIILGI